MTETICHCDRTPIETIERRYALRDEKGREIGGLFNIASLTYSPRPEGSTWGCPHEPGTVIVGRPHATRDGKSYGASQRQAEFASIEEARAAAEVYFAKAAKRAGRR